MFDLSRIWEALAKMRQNASVTVPQPNPVVAPAVITGQFRLSARSLSNLQGVHPDLVSVVERAIQITELDFVVIEGLRTLERQRELVRIGASRTLNSRHLTGHAVDLAVYHGGQIRWDWPLYDKLSFFVFKAANEVNVPVEWGGDWRTFKDGPHWQLPSHVYNGRRSR